MEKELDFSAEIQRDIFGMQDAHVRKIEKELQVSIVSRNGTMKVVGDKNNVEAAVVLLEDMAGLSEHGSEVTSQQVDYALDMKGDAEPGMLIDIDDGLDSGLRSDHGPPFVKRLRLCKLRLHGNPSFRVQIAVQAGGAIRNRKQAVRETVVFRFQGFRYRRFPATAVDDELAGRIFR